MKTLHSALYILLFSVLPIFLIGQSIPFSVNYQAIARDTDGLPIANAAVDAEIVILQSGESGPEVYSEIHSTMTNEFGLYLFVIGEGSTSDDLSLIDWAADNYYLKTITSIDNGDPLEAVAKLNSVPYSFVSYKSVIDNVDDADSDIQNELQDLELNGSQLSISKGNSVDLSSLMSGGTAVESLTTIELDQSTNTLNYTDENGDASVIELCSVIDNCESVTALAYDNITNELVYIDENNETTVTSLADLISTISNLNDGNVIASHISGDGTVTNIEETVTEIVDNNDGTFTYTNEDGTAFTFGLSGSGIGAESLTSIQLDNNTNSLNYIDENGDANVIDLCPVIDNCETLTALAFDPALSHLVYLDEDGTTNEIDLSSLLSGGGSGSNTLTELSYDPFSNQLNYQDENGNLNVIDMGSLLSQFENLNDGNVIASHISGDGTVTNIEETVTEIVDNNDGTFTYTNEDGTAFTFGLSGSGIGAESLTSIQLDNNSNSLNYIDENGNANVIDLCPVIDNCETLTALAFDPALSHLVYLDEDGTTNNIDLSSLLSGGGSGSNTLTELSYDPFSNQLNYQDENGNLNVIDMGSLLSQFENLNNGNIIASHISGDGTVTNIEETVTEIVDNNDGTFTYTNEDGTAFTFGLSGSGIGAESLTSIQLDNNSNSLNYIDENGNANIIDLCPVIDNCETLTALAFDPALSLLVYLDEDGTTNNIDLSSLLSGGGSGSNTLTELSYDPFSNQLNYQDENGNLNVIDMGSLLSQFENLNNGNIIASHISGDGTVTDINESITTIVDNNDGTYTYTNESGDAFTFEGGSSGGGLGNNTLTTLSFDDLTSQLNYQDENGNLNVIDMGSLASHFTDLNDGHIIGTHTSGDGTVADIEESISTLVDNGDGTLTYTNEDGTSTTFTGESTGTNTGGSSGNELTVLTYSPLTNQLEYIDENGDTNIIDLGDIVSTFTDLNDGNIIATHTSGDGTVTQIEETLTTIADNGDGTFSYTSEDGTNITYDTQYERDVYMSLVGTNPVDQSSLHYVALAGPEAAAYERGESTLSNGEFFVAYSDHFKQTINSTTVTVQVTPYSADTYGLAVTQRTADGFLVKELKGGTSNFTFSWEVKAVRKGLENLSISN